MLSLTSFLLFSSLCPYCPQVLTFSFQTIFFFLVARKVKETGGRKTRLLCLIYGGIFLEWNLGRGGSHTLERRGSERRRTFGFYWPRSKGTVSLHGFGSVSVWKPGESALWIVVLWLWDFGNPRFGSG